MSWTRRRLLTGLGTAAGATLLAPFLRSVARADPAAPPRRFVFFVEGNGIEPVCMMSAGARAAIDAEISRSTVGERYFPSLYGHDAPLEVVDDLSTARSLAALGTDLAPRALQVLGLSSLINGGGHTTYCGALSSTRSSPERPGGITIDALLAAMPAVRGDTPFDALRVGVHALPAALGQSTCAYGVDRAAPILMDPAVAYTNTFGSAAVGSAGAAFARRGDLLDFAHGDVTRALAAFSGNSEERAKLEQYLQSIEAIQVRQSRLASMGSQLSLVAPPSPASNPLVGTSDPMRTLQAQVQLATAALLGELTHVVVIASGTGPGFDLRYPSIWASSARHDLHHRSHNRQAYIDAIHDVTAGHVAMFADMARTLAATPEPGHTGSMLDHTTMVLMSDNGERHHSRSEEYPALIVGGNAMGMRTDGRTVVFPGVRNAHNRQLSNLFNTLCHAAGSPVDDFGAEGPARIAEGPLSELWS
jgi:hypothetical protein